MSDLAFALRCSSCGGEAILDLDRGIAAGIVIVVRRERRRRQALSSGQIER